MSNETGKIRKNKKQSKDDEDQPELSKEEKQIAYFLRLSCPHKQGNLVGMKVDFFIGSKLVDCLMESKWGPQTTAKNKTPLFASRQACILFMQRLMNKQMFYRATKIYKESSNLSVENKENSDVTPNLKKRKTAANKEVKEGETPQTSQQQQQQAQQKRKFKLEMHDDQKFLDSTDPFVWVYDPTSTKTYIIGSLLILGAIGICLFPLWPSQVREGVYYLSLGGASLLGAILALAGIKYVLFAFLWVVTLGKIHFWLFPNLTEDVGFFESFVPVYKCNLGSSSNNNSKTSSKSETKTKNQTLQWKQVNQLNNNNNKPPNQLRNQHRNQHQHLVKENHQLYQQIQQIVQTIPMFY